MKPLITCIHHPNFIDRQGHYVGLREHDEVAKVVVEASPRDVLHAVFPNCYVDSYQGFTPWMVKCGDKHTYLSIEEAKEEHKFFKISSLRVFFQNPDFSSSLRDYDLTYGKFKLVDSLTGRLDPGSPHIFEVDNQVCVDILDELGFNMPIEKIREIVKKQVDNYSTAFMIDEQERFRRASDVAGLMHQVVGCEVPNTD